MPLLKPLNQEIMTSILCSMSKVGDRIVLDQISLYLIDYNMFDSRYTGSRPGMGTHTAFIRFAGNIRCGIDEQMITIAVFLDFAKAFESVDNLLLLHKLCELDFSAKAIR